MTKNTNFNIHTFNLDDYKNDLYKEQLKENNRYFLIIDTLLDYENYLPKRILSNYYNINDNKKSLKLSIDKDFKNIILETKGKNVLKNRILLDKIKDDYFCKDHYNFITTDLEKGIKNNTDQIFTGYTYKDFVTYAKMIRNLFLCGLIIHKEKFLIDLSHIYNNHYNFSNDFQREIWNYKKISTENNLNLDQFKKWIEYFISKILSSTKDTIENKINIANNIFLNSGLSSQKIDDIFSISNWLYLGNNISNTISSSKIYSIFQKIFTSFDTYKKYMNLLIGSKKNQLLSINNIINKTFEYDNFIKSKLNKISYTKEIEKINPVSGFKSKINSRIAFDVNKQSEVDELTRQVNSLSSFQQELSDAINITLLKYKKENNYHFEIVSGNNIKYYYNVVNYENNGYSHSVYKYGNPFLQSLSLLNGYNHLKTKEGELFNSCMRSPGNFAAHEWYKNNKQVSLLILTNENKTLIRGRAIIWHSNEKDYVDRIFTNCNEANLQFAEYINNSSLIPIYSYTGISKDKNELRKDWQNNKHKDFEFDSKNLSVLSYVTPYLDTMRNFKFGYDYKSNKFKPVDSNSTLTYNPSTNEIKYNSKDNCVCSLCGHSRNSVYFKNIEYGNKRITVCKDHINTIPKIYGDKSIIIYDNTIYNTKENTGFALLRICDEIKDNTAQIKLEYTELKDVYKLLDNNDYTVTQGLNLRSYIISKDISKDIKNPYHWAVSNNVERDDTRFISRIPHQNIYNKKILLDYLQSNPLILSNAIASMTTYILEGVVDFLNCNREKKTDSKDNLILRVSPTNRSKTLRNIKSALEKNEKKPNVDTFKKHLSNKEGFSDKEVYDSKYDLLNMSYDSHIYIPKDNIIDFNKNHIMDNFSPFGNVKTRFSENLYIDSSEIITYLDTSIFNKLYDAKSISKYKMYLLKSTYNFYKELVELNSNLDLIIKEPESEKKEEPIKKVGKVVDNTIISGLESNDINEVFNESLVQRVMYTIDQNEETSTRRYRLNNISGLINHMRAASIDPII